MENFNKEFNRTSKMFSVIFWFAVIMVVISTVAQFSAVGYIGYKLASVFETADAKDIAKELGEVVKEFEKARE